MKNLKYILLVSTVALSLLLTACGAAQEAPVQKGPYTLPSDFDINSYSPGYYDESCKDNWVYKMSSGDANFAGFEVDSEAINTNTKPNKYGIDSMVTYHLFLKAIRIEDYRVDILKQTIDFIPNPEAGPAQILDENSVLARANELAKTAPDIRIGILYTYLPEKFDTEDWVVEFPILCDPTNTMNYTVPW